MPKLIGFVLFLGGVGTGVLATKTFFKVRYEEILNLEIASVKTVYNEKLKEKLATTLATDHITKLNENLAKTLETEPVAVSDDGTSVVKTVLTSLGYTSVSDMLKQSVSENEYRNVFDTYENSEENDEDADEDPDEVDEDEIDPDDIREPIEIVDFTSYDMDYPNYDKLVITYYEADDTLADERGEIMDDISSTVGLDSLTKFGEKSNFRNTVHVRNHNLSADYEISRVPGAYSEEILGVPRMRLAPRKYKLRESDE